MRGVLTFVRYCIYIYQFVYSFITIQLFNNLKILNVFEFKFKRELCLLFISPKMRMTEQDCFGTALAGELPSMNFMTK